MKLYSKLKAFFCKEELEADMAEEMRHHLEMQEEANRAAGMSSDEARYAAQRQFGHADSIKEAARDQRGWVWLEQFGQDLRYALRQLVRNRGFTVTVVLVLALGIGANTAIFSVVDALLFRPLPVKDPSGLQAVTFLSKENFLGEKNLVMADRVAFPYLAAFRKENHSFSDFIGSAVIDVVAKAEEGETGRVIGHLVTGNYFSVLGIQPALGRGIIPADDEAPGRQAVAVISYEYWQGQFGGKSAVIGRTLYVNKQPLTIVGVAPRGFHGLESIRGAQFWAPTTMERTIGASYNGYDMVGRLAAGVTRAQAITELDAICRQLATAYPERGPQGYEQWPFFKNYHTTLLPAAKGVVGSMQRGSRANFEKLAALFGGAVGLVLLVACSNAANLLLVRALARRREIAVRLTLGATRWRLLRQLLVESMLLSLLAAALGLLLAYGEVKGLQAPHAGPMKWLAVDAAVNGRVLAFTLGLAMLTGFVFGLVPSIQALRFDLNATLKQETPIASTRHRKFTLGQFLMVAQVAISLVLLSGAGVCVHSFAKLLAVDPGFNMRNILTAVGNLNWDEYPAKVAHPLVNRLLQGVEALPGVQMVSVSDSMVPLGGGYVINSVDQLEGYAKSPGEGIQFVTTRAGPGYFRLLQIPVVLGREFDRNDLADRPKVAVVNESFVRRYWSGQNPLGKHVMDGAEVIGVVADSRTTSLWREPEPRYYSAFLQEWPGNFMLLLKTENDPALLAPLLRTEMERQAKSLKSADIDTLRNIRSSSLAGHRMMALLLLVFSITTLVLASVGLYGFIACSVARRTREIGIRAALGAQYRDVMALVMGQGLRLISVGLAIGFTLALFATQALKQWIYGITPLDTATFVTVTMLLAAVAMLACWLPARRAAKLDPMVALRAE